MWSWKERCVQPGDAIPGARSARPGPVLHGHSLAFPPVVAGPMCPREKHRRRRCLGPAFFRIPASRLTGLRALPGTCVRPGPHCSPQPRLYLLLMGVGWALVPWVRNPPGPAVQSCPWLAAGAQCRWLVLGGAAGVLVGGPSWGPWGAGVGAEDRLGWTHLGPHQGCRGCGRRGPGHAPGGRPHSARALLQAQASRHGPDALLSLPGFGCPARL